MTDQMAMLLTRPADQAERFAEAVAARLGRGLRIVVSPALEIVEAPGAARLADPDGLRGVGALAFTSENGVRIFARRCARRDLPAFCVGARTAAAARAARLRALEGPGDAAGLAPLIAWQARLQGQGRVLHLRGVHAAADLAAALRDLGQPADDLVIYDQRARPLSADAHAVLGSPGIVLLPLFSARSARLVLPALSHAQAELRIAAISPAVAHVARVQRCARMEIAVRPDAEAMLDALAGLAGSR